jgi:hypothetical protein
MNCVTLSAAGPRATYVVQDDFMVSKSGADAGSTYYVVSCGEVRPASAVRAAVTVFNMLNGGGGGGSVRRCWGGCTRPQAAHSTISGTCSRRAIPIRSSGCAACLVVSGP